MHDEIRWVCAQLDVDPAVRAIVITGAGQMFCAGADFKALDRHLEIGHYDPGVSVEAANPGYGVRPEFDGDMVWQLGMRKPMIAAVNGGCAGIGLALAAFCDLRFAVEDAKITTAAPKLGLPAEYGLSWILPRLIGATRSADLLLTGRVLPAREMRNWGFFNDVVAREELAGIVAKYSRMLCSVSPEAVTITKRQLWGDLLHGNPLGSVEESKQLIARMMQEPDYAESVRARAESRTPRFGPAVG